MRRLFIVAALLLIDVAVQAQVCCGGACDAGCPAYPACAPVPCNPPAPVPIPGIALMFLAGLALGIFKLDKRKSN